MQHDLDARLTAQIHHKQQEFGGFAVDCGRLAAASSKVEDLDRNHLRCAGLPALRPGHACGESEAE
jgi:hypothetical protein